MSNLYFNARDWVRLGCTQQQIKFLEGLLERIGGSATPENDLTAVNTAIADVNSALATLDNTVSGLTIQVSEILNSEDEPEDPESAEVAEVVEDLRGALNILFSEIKRTTHRVNQIEDGL